jgi:hypothetical protein
MAAFLVASVLLLAPAIFPQEKPSSKAPLRDPNFRSLSGRVSNPDRSPAAGAIVKLKNMKTLQILSYITQSEGAFQFNNLSTAIDYELHAEREDLISKRRTLSVFDQRPSAVIDLKLAPRKKPKNAEPSPRP